MICKTLPGVTLIFCLFVSALLIFTGCTRTPVTPIVLSSDKEITSFVFKALDNAGSLSNDITGSISGDSIKVYFETGTNLSALVPTITFKGKTISPTSGSKQNFTSPIQYTVTADDGSIRNYTVVKGFVSGNKVISSFIFRSVDNSPNLSTDISGVISNDSIVLMVPYSTSVTGLIPMVTITGKSIAPASMTRQDFSKPVIYTVNATDGTNKNYVVTVVKATSTITGDLFIAGRTDDGYYSTGMVCDLDAASGQIKWMYPTNTAIYGEPEVANGLVMSAEVGGNIFALDQKTGASIWKFTAGVGKRFSATMTVANGILYEGGNDSTTYALHVADGSLVWKIKSAGGVSSPTVLNNVLYESTGRSLIALNAATGAVLWTSYPSSLDTAAGFPVNPAVVNGILYTACSDHYIYALDAGTGTTIWTYKTTNVNGSNPTVVNGVVYIVGGGSVIYALDAQTGKVKWIYDNEYDSDSSPIVVNGVLYYGAGGNSGSSVVALDAGTGIVKWRSPLDNNQQSSPLYFNGGIFIADYDGLFAFDALTGNLIWKVAYNRNIFSSATGVDLQDNVYRTSDTGEQN